MRWQNDGDPHSIALPVGMSGSCPVRQVGRDFGSAQLGIQVAGTGAEPSNPPAVNVPKQHRQEDQMPKEHLGSTRGFASMDMERQREIASKGGRSVPAEKRSFSQDRGLASEAGRKGGQSSGIVRDH
jgi:general stress protein YciG